MAHSHQGVLVIPSAQPGFSALICRFVRPGPGAVMFARVADSKRFSNFRHSRVLHAAFLCDLKRTTTKEAVMLRKHVFKAPLTPSVPHPEEIDIAATTMVQVTSEDPAHPIDNVFDHQRGPGGSRWVAEEPGEQTLLLAFDTPQTIHQIILEVEEPEVSRMQELWLSVSHDGGQTYRELRRQEYNFSPPDTVFEREDWVVLAEGVTHLQLWMKPDKGGKPCRATLTSLIFKRA